MELRSHLVTMYLGALALVAACSSSNVNSNPFEQATQNIHYDAGTNAPPAPTASTGTGSSSGGASSGDKGAAAGCSSEADCNGGCAGATPCCCDTGSMTCYSPESGACPNSGGGSDGSAGGGDDGSSTGDDSGGMQMMP